jgi:hypothetical protein
MADGNSILSDNELQSLLAETGAEDASIPEFEDTPSTETQFDSTLSSIEEDLSELEGLLDDSEEATTKDSSTSPVVASGETEDLVTSDKTETAEASEATKQAVLEGTNAGVAGPRRRQFIAKEITAIIQNGVVAALLNLDRPFHSLERPVKQAAGYAGLATSAVAAATWLLSYWATWP